MKEGTRWKKSSEHKGLRLFGGKRYILYDSLPTKAQAKVSAKKLKSVDTITSVRITKSLYYGDWNVWVRTKRS